MTINKAWETLFDRHNILSRIESDSVFNISATEISKVKEARLMAKFDKSSQLPEVFQENNLSILPVTRGEYLIGRFQTHDKIAYPIIKPRPVAIPNLQTLDFTNLYSESSALLFAFNSGIIQDIMGSDKVWFTVNGRMSSGGFDFIINDSVAVGNHHAVSVQNAQVEIDAGYESRDSFCICEAKNMATEELLIRQLYYPYRLWQGKISKEIIPVFFVFSNDVFHLFRYGFEDIKMYNSIKLLEHKAYTFADEDITLDEIIELWKNIKVIAEPTNSKNPFPQADSFERVLDLLAVLHERPLTSNEITLKYEFASRQTDYYIAACRYLDLIDLTQIGNREVGYKLSPLAQGLMSLRYKQKHIALITKILERPVFHKAFEIAINAGEIPDKTTVCKIMRDCGLPIGGATVPRRSSTVRAWLNWIFKICIAD